jgi:hypothetical protein
MANEYLWRVLRERSRTLLLRQRAKYRPYHAAPVVTQHVHAIYEQRSHGVGVYRDAIAHDVRSRRKTADLSEAKRTKQADE